MSRVSVCAAVAAACLFTLPHGAHAESLGLRWFEAGVATTDSGQPSAHLSGDWRIGPAQGIQLDLGLADHDGGAVGEVGLHLSLLPQTDRKYGFFATLADVDGREATSLHAGVEAMAALTPDWTVEARAGIGRASDGLDFISGEARVGYAVSDTLLLSAGAMLADFDEAALRAIGWRADIGLTWLPQGAPVELAATLVQDGLGGRDAAAARTRVELGVIWRFGAGGARRPVAERAFAVTQPLDPLIRRGLF